MQLTDLDYEYPATAVATEPSRPTRVAWKAFDRAPEELTVAALLARIGPEDLLVVNESKVVPARVFTADETEVLFLKERNAFEWEVLFPARDYKVGAELRLPGGVSAVLVQKGLPQVLRVETPLTPRYFEAHGEMALPPYIQDARAERHNRGLDAGWYQTAWARDPGSVAAPTASLHFTAEDLARVPRVAKITLHVGAGTFLPVRTVDLRQHVMHAERVEVPLATREALAATRGRVWALGTTVARTLESLDLLDEQGRGETRLFIYPPYEFKVVDVLLTNFHQPRSTLLALVAAFAGLDDVKATYRWAVERGFHLFSYGDLSAWTKP